jgi:hypothetical protein
VQQLLLKAAAFTKYMCKKEEKNQYLRLLPLFSAALFATFETTTFFSSPMLFTIVLRLLARKISFIRREQGSFLVHFTILI